MSLTGQFIITMEKYVDAKQMESMDIQGTEKHSYIHMPIKSYGRQAIFHNYH